MTIHRREGEPQSSSRTTFQLGDIQIVREVTEPVLFGSNTLRRARLFMIDQSGKERQIPLPEKTCLDVDSPSETISNQNVFIVHGNFEPDNTLYRSPNTRFVLIISNTGNAGFYDHILNSPHKREYTLSPDGKQITTVLYYDNERFIQTITLHYKPPEKPNEVGKWIRVDIKIEEDPTAIRERERTQKVRNHVPTEAIIPQEIRVVNTEPVRFGNDSANRKIVVQVGSKKEPLYYKRPNECGETKKIILGGTPVYSRINSQLTPEEALTLAEEKREEYQNAVACFGKNHVVKTSFTVGLDTTYNAPQTHMYQELIDPLIDGEYMAKQLDIPIDAVVERLLSIKKKTLGELDTNDEIESWVQDNIEVNKKRLQRFYSSYVETMLMGFIPDIQYHIRNNGSHDNIGLLFSTNIGTSSKSNQVVLVDFGTPRFDVLTLESRNILRVLIDFYKIQRQELPVHITPSGERILAPWYEKALRREIERSLQQKEHVGMLAYGEEISAAHILEKIKDNALGINPQDQEYYEELESFRRLSDSPIYGTHCALQGVPLQS